MSKLKQFVPLCFSGILLSLVIWQVQPPQNLAQASALQIIALFVPMFLFTLSLAYLIFKSIPLSIICSFTVILILTLKALELLNIITFIIIVIAMSLIIKSLKKDKKSPYQTKIPKLSQLKKQ